MPQLLSVGTAAACCLHQHGKGTHALLQRAAAVAGQLCSAVLLPARLAASPARRLGGAGCMPPATTAVSWAARNMIGCLELAAGAVQRRPLLLVLVLQQVLVLRWARPQLVQSMHAWWVHGQPAVARVCAAWCVSEGHCCVLQCGHTWSALPPRTGLLQPIPSCQPAAICPACVMPSAP